jgi:CRISPR type III-B/RAMP module-associated protein Cmr5
MKNLEQIRAVAALDPAKKLDKSAINKLPAMILGNGLLATIAFCEAESGGDNRSDMKSALFATTEHLAGQKLLAAPHKSLLEVVKDLSNRDSHHLQRATTEALAFIGYLRRFAKKANNSSQK